jgi:hypothetical protein
MAKRKRPKGQTTIYKASALFPETPIIAQGE